MYPAVGGRLSLPQPTAFTLYFSAGVKPCTAGQLTTHEPFLSYFFANSNKKPIVSTWQSHQATLTSLRERPGGVERICLLQPDTPSGKAMRGHGRPAAQAAFVLLKTQTSSRRVRRLLGGKDLSATAWPARDDAMGRSLLRHFNQREDVSCPPSTFFRTNEGRLGENEGCRRARTEGSR